MVRIANSSSHCTTVMGEYAFINTLTGPSVLLLHSEIGSVMWFEPKCSSWAIPVCLVCLKHPYRFCTSS